MVFPKFACIVDKKLLDCSQRLCFLVEYAVHLFQ